MDIVIDYVVNTIDTINCHQVCFYYTCQHQHVHRTDDN